MSYDVTSGDFQTVWECDLEFCNCVCGFFGGVSTNLRIELLRGQSTLSQPHRLFFWVIVCVCCVCIGGGGGGGNLLVSSKHRASGTLRLLAWG